MTETTPPTDPNLRAMAEEALDLWQNYLDSYATDPKAKGELAQMFTPMQQMMKPWADMMQNSFVRPADPQAGPANQAANATAQSAPTAAQATEPSSQNSAFAESEGKNESHPAPSASPALERRVAELESRLTQLESCVASSLATALASLRRDAERS